MYICNDLNKKKLVQRCARNAFEIVNMAVIYKLRRTFKVSRLKDAAAGDRTWEQDPSPPLSVEKLRGEEEEAWEVAEIIGWRRNGRNGEG